MWRHTAKKTVLCVDSRSRSTFKISLYNMYVRHLNESHDDKISSVSSDAAHGIYRSFKSLFALNSYIVVIIIKFKSHFR